MSDQRDLLEVLKFELEFLEKGGYGRSPRAAWRPPRIFEDSPSCLNFALPEKLHPCCECELMALVPEQDRDKAVPCDHIPLNAAGETVETLYRYASQHEIEEVLKQWLRASIQRLEQAREQGAQAKPPESSKEEPEAIFRCANSMCSEKYDARAGGRFFRFHMEPEEPEERNTHGVRHFWLCSHCSLVFTMSKETGRGPALTLRWKELPDPDKPKVLPVT
jgi:hypothetical protein